MSVGDSNSGRHGRLVFSVVAAAIFMSNLDLFIVNVALPSIGADFGGSLARLSWILNGYAIAFAALLIGLRLRKPGQVVTVGTGSGETERALSTVPTVPAPEVALSPSSS